MDWAYHCGGSPEVSAGPSSLAKHSHFAPTVGKVKGPEKQYRAPHYSTPVLFCSYLKSLFTCKCCVRTVRIRKHEQPLEMVLVGGMMRKLAHTLRLSSQLGQDFGEVRQPEKPELRNRSRADLAFTNLPSMGV